MPEFPYVYGLGSPRGVEPGGRRIRFLRRRAGKGGDSEDPAEKPEEHDAEEASWRVLLEDAVEQLNASFGRSAIPFLCVLEEDENGLSLRIRREGEDGSTETVDEEILERSEFPRWLERIRSQLGLLVDETA